MTIYYDVKVRNVCSEIDKKYFNTAIFPYSSTENMKNHESNMKTGYQT